MTDPVQLELQPATTPLFLIREDHANVKWLVALLRARGWMTRKMILAEARKADTAYSERWVRALVQAAGAEVVKGQDGFNHFENCKLDDITHAANQSISQGKLMIQYGVALRRRVHGRVG